MSTRPKKRVLQYVTADEKQPMEDWLESLDLETQAIIYDRYGRFEQGNLGDYKGVGKGVFEHRINFGPGYRIYFGLKGEDLVILLCGGDKKSQSRDIRQAQEYWADYKRRTN